MADTDVLDVPLLYNNSQDFDLSQQKVGVQNPGRAHYTSVEPILDLANVAATTYRKEYNTAGYPDGSIDIELS